MAIIMLSTIYSSKPIEAIIAGTRIKSSGVPSGSSAKSAIVPSFNVFFTITNLRYVNLSSLPPYIIKTTGPAKNGRNLMLVLDDC